MHFIFLPSKKEIPIDKLAIYMHFTPTTPLAIFKKFDLVIIISRDKMSAKLNYREIISVYNFY
jgi:hypothetical protein